MISASIALHYVTNELMAAGNVAFSRSFQVGREKFLIPWLFVINRNSREVPMIDVHLVSPVYY